MAVILELTNTKKHQRIYSTVPPQSTLSSFHQRGQILYNILCIRHTRLTHSYLIDHTDPSECTNCHHYFL